MRAKLGRIPLAIAGALALVGPGTARSAEGPRPALTVRFVHPDRQLDRVMALFDGSRVSSPAEALASWRRASGRRLSKTLEAAIAALNPEMARELRILDDAEVVVGFDPADGRTRWHVAVPGDDGTLAALATAMSLTDGGPDAPLNGIEVDRLGPPGSPLMARSAPGVVAAGSRDDLRIALEREPPGPSPIATGWLVRLDPEGLAAPGSLARRRLAEGLRAVGCRQVEAVAGLDGAAFSLVATARFAEPRPTSGTLDPSWLDPVPADRTIAAVALATGRPIWDAVFAVADRVEKADPARARAAPVRTRWNLLALAAGVRPEVELWPRLFGLTACVLADRSGAIDGGLLALHAVDEPAAERLAGVIVPRLGVAFHLADGPAAEDDRGVRRLGRVAGRPLMLARRGPMVLLAWGEPTLPACLDALDHSDHSASALIRSGWGPKPPRRAGALWPGRLPGLSPALASALAASAPVLWHGQTEGHTTTDEIRWAGLDAAVRQFLERLSLKPFQR